MVPPTVDADLPLNPVAVFGKATPAGEVQVLSCSAGQLSAEAMAVAADWLQRFLGTTNTRVAAVARLGGEWWVVRTDREATADAVGRPRGFATLGRLPHAPPAVCSADLLLRFARRHIVRDDPPRSAEAGEPTPGVQSAAAAAAALALALGQTVGVGALGEATAVLARVGLRRAGWVALFHIECPSVLPAGQGLVIAPNPPPPPPELTAVVAASGPAAVFALPLDSLPAVLPTQILRLVKAALSAVSLTAVGPLDREAATWLIAAGLERAAVLDRLNDGAVGEWLESPAAAADDVGRLSGRLTLSHAPAVRRLFRHGPDPLADYLRHYPTDWAGAANMLPDELADVRAALLEPERPPPLGPSVDRYLAAAGPLVGELDLSAAARGAVAGSYRGRRLLITRLGEAGVPPEVAVYLLGGPLAPPPASRSPAAPAHDGWLVAVDPDRWLAAARQWAGWREWLVDGVRRLVVGRRLAADAVVAAGATDRAADLLRAGDAPEGVIALAEGPVTALTGAWPAAAFPLLEKLLADGELFRRIDPSAGEDTLDWLDALSVKEGDVFLAFGRFWNALRNGTAADPRWLGWTVRLLYRRTVLTQAAQWAVQPFDHPDRVGTLNRLLQSHRLSVGEREWLAARTLHCIPLPASPVWSATDMVALFPLLDPVRDVVRVVLGWAEEQEGEAALMRRVLTVLSARPTDPPGAFPETANQHPNWVRELCRLPGWSAAAAPTARLALVRRLCRELEDAGGPGMAADSPLRRAVHALAE